MDYYTEGIESSCPYDLGLTTVKEVICPQGFICGACTVGKWASRVATAASILAGGALLLSSA